MQRRWPRGEQHLLDPPAKHGEPGPGAEGRLTVRGMSRFRDRYHRGLRLAAVPGPFEALCPKFQEVHGLVVQALPFVSVPQGVAHNPPSHFRPEIIIVIELIYASHHFFFRKMGVLDVR